MKQLHHKIEEHKNDIEAKKASLKRDFNEAKQRLLSKGPGNLLTIGGLVVGFLLMPKKYKVLKGLLKAYTIATTAKQFLNFLPEKKEIKSKPKLRRIK